MLLPSRVSLRIYFFARLRKRARAAQLQAGIELPINLTSINLPPAPPPRGVIGRRQSLPFSHQ
jgi:hypothetical protein